MGVVRSHRAQARLKQPAALNLWLGSAVLLMVAWTMKASVQPD